MGTILRMIEKHYGGLIGCRLDALEAPQASLLTFRA